MRTSIILLLIFLYGLYLILGAFVFHSLEHGREAEMCQKTLEELSKYNLTSSKGSIGSGSIKELVKLILMCSSNGIEFDSHLNPSCAHNWNFENAFFFAGTVITTIGYGNIAPATWHGRLFCIFYATVGLPLFGIMFTEIGSIFATFFKRLESKLRKKISIERLRYCCVLITLLATLTVFFILIPSAMFVLFENWSFGDSFYYSFITLTTIGFGDFVAGVNPDIEYMSLDRVAVYFWVLFGLAFMAAIVNVTSEVTKGKDKNPSSSKENQKENHDVARTCGSKPKSTSLRL